MIISPKCSTNPDDLKQMLPRANEHIEIQNFKLKHHTTLIDDCQVLKHIITNSKVRSITYHMPNILCNVETLLVSRHVLHSVYVFILECNHIAATYGINIKLLFHTEVQPQSIMMHSVVNTVKQLKLRCNENVEILLENPIINPNCLHDGLAVFEVAYLTDVSLCIDITHLRASMHILKPYVSDEEEQFKLICGKYYNKVLISQVHIAKAGNEDGFVDRSTHGVYHSDRFELQRDLELVNKFNYEDSLIYVTEVSEVDYSDFKHPNQIKELELLNAHRDFSTRIVPFKVTSGLYASNDERQEASCFNFKIPYRKGV